MVKSLEGRRHNYYEGIMQLRDVSPEFVESVITEIQDSGKAEIAKVRPERHGVDVYLSDQHYTQSLGKSLKNRFGGEIKITKKLYGRTAKHGQIVFRVTVLFRKYLFNIGDVITTEDGDIKILGIGTNVQVQHLRSKKKEMMRVEQVERYLR